MGREISPRRGVISITQSINTIFAVDAQCEFVLVARLPRKQFRISQRAFRDKIKHGADACTVAQQQLRALIDEDRCGRVPLAAPVTLLKQQLAEHPNAYFNNQVYLDLSPDAVRPDALPR